MRKPRLRVIRGRGCECQDGPFATPARPSRITAMCGSNPLFPACVLQVAVLILLGKVKGNSASPLFRSESFEAELPDE